MTEVKDKMALMRQRRAENQAIKAQNARQSQENIHQFNATRYKQLICSLKNELELKDFQLQLITESFRQVMYESGLSLDQIDDQVAEIMTVEPKKNAQGVPSMRVID